MEPTATNPIHALRQQSTCLEAAISRSLATPTRKAVHELRSETRRIEAHLDLLQRMHGLRPYRPAAEKLLRRLHKLRGLAGRVRDCDVQRKLLKGGDGEPTSQHESNESLEQNESLKELRPDIETLRKILRRHRRRAERKLLHSLEKQQSKLAGDLETVLNALKPAETAEIPSHELLASIARKFNRSLRFHGAGEKKLHDLRKAAKHARYQCEALPGAPAAAFAEQLETLQDAGGSWHDLLELAKRGSNKLGARHPLTLVLEHHRDEHLNRYLEKLESFRQFSATAASPRKRRVSSRLETEPGPAAPHRRTARNIQTAEASLPATFRKHRLS
jgi:CHAD domain-containing protein